MNKVEKLIESLALEQGKLHAKVRVNPAEKEDELYSDNGLFPDDLRSN